jgi:hypothetical protein
MSNGAGTPPQQQTPEKEVAGATPEKEVAGAIVAAVGLVALVVIVLIAIESLPDAGKSSNVVAIASSAFGVIGAIVGAYFGIRAAKNAVDQNDSTR